MKVLFLIDTLEIGGAEQSILELCKKFRKTQGIVCHIYRGDRLKPALEEAGIPVFSLNITGKYSFLKGRAAVEKIIREELPDLIHSTLFRSGIVARLISRSRKIPVVDSFVNDSYAPVRWKSMPPLTRMKLHAFQLMDRLTARWVFRFSAITEAVKKSNCRALGVPEEKVHVIHRGRELTQFQSCTASQLDQLRSELKIGTGVPVLLNVARLIRRKGHLELIQAMPGVLESFPSARLLIAGEGQDRPVLQELIKKTGISENIQLLGNRSDVQALLQLADVFVFPSHYEGHGGALVEAMFAAKPIVATDIEVIRESIEHQVSALLFPLCDVRGMQQAILRMLNDRDEASRMGKNARDAAITKFSIDQVVRKTEDFYEDTVARWNRQSG